MNQWSCAGTLLAVLLLPCIAGCSAGIQTHAVSTDTFTTNASFDQVARAVHKLATRERAFISLRPSILEKSA